MPLDVPESFAQRYTKLRPILEIRLLKLQEELGAELRKLNLETGSRARVSDRRVKKPRSLWRKVQELKASDADAFTAVEDVLGLRVVCNNISDVAHVEARVKERLADFRYRDRKDYISSPRPSGYRALHLVGHLECGPDVGSVGCEIQVRTLAQDTWGRLSRDDFYRREVPDLIQRLAKSLADSLRAIDDTAQILHDELVKPAKRADEIKDADSISPERLALLYEQEIGYPIDEFSLLQWNELLRDAEAETIGEVRALLTNEKILGELNDISDTIRDRWLESFEIPLYTALVASELSIPGGLAEAEKTLRSEWAEVTRIVLAEVMPGTIEEFIEKLEGGSSIEEELRALDCIKDCRGGCGYTIAVDSYDAYEAVTGYYGKDDETGKLDSLLSAALDDHVSVGSVPGFCWHCTKMLDD